MSHQDEPLYAQKPNLSLFIVDNRPLTYAKLLPYSTAELRQELLVLAEDIVVHAKDITNYLESLSRHRDVERVREMVQKWEEVSPAHMRWEELRRRDQASRCSENVFRILVLDAVRDVEKVREWLEEMKVEREEKQGCCELL